MEKYKLIVRYGNGEYINMTVTHIKKEENVVYAYRGEDFVGFFDLGAIDMLYLNNWADGRA